MAVKADVRVSVEAKEASKKRFIAEKNRIITSLDRLQREVNNVRGWWKGAGGSAFVETFSRVKAEITAGIESRVADYCALMDTTVESILETDRQLAQKVGLAGVNTAPRTAAFGATGFGLNPSLNKMSNSIFSPDPSKTHVRAAFEARADVQEVKWKRTELGKSTITVTFNNGTSEKTLKEGEDYYINKNGNACFYNNVRTLLEASGASVNFIQHPVGSIIEVLQNGILIRTLVEGTDYNIGADKKAHFLDMAYGPLPPGAVGAGTSQKSGRSENNINKYELTLEEALNKQIITNPQTQKGNKWVGANKDEVRKYLDPNNYNEGVNKYQFLDLSSQAGISKVDMAKYLTGKGILEGQEEVYLAAAQKYNVSEVYLAAHSALETGNGKSKLATGVEVNGVTVYNMYGIGAFDRDPVGGGSQYAYKMGWDTPEKAIEGGAKWISEQYINNPSYQQNTLYKMRWNPASPGEHQYATDIGWAVKQTTSIKKMYDDFPDALLQFEIPIYKDSQ